MRRYPRAKFVCMETEADLDRDPFKDWDRRYDSPMEAWQDLRKREKDYPPHMMFKKLFRYIIGVNTEAEEIEMTSPVITKHMPVSGTSLRTNREMQTMCFWAGSRFNREELPRPIDRDVYPEEMESMEVFVR